MAMSLKGGGLGPAIKEKKLFKTCFFRRSKFQQPLSSRGGGALMARPLKKTFLAASLIQGEQLYINVNYPAFYQN